MAKRLSVLFFLACAVSLYAQDSRFSIGLKAGASLFCNDQSGSGLAAVDFAGGAYFDLIYARLCVDYETALGGSTYDATSADTAFSQTSFSFLNLSLVGKLPVNAGIFKLWPALGLRCQLPLSFTLSGNNLMGSEPLGVPEWYLLGGWGIDADLGGFSLTCQVLYAGLLFGNPLVVSLPFPLTGTADVHVSGSELEITFGIGIKL